MGERFQRRCSELGCTTRTADRSGYCPAHVHDNMRTRARAAFDKERHQSPVAKMYNAGWDKLKEMLRHRGNVICQRLVDGKQCQHRAEIYHHLVSPREDSSLMYIPTNVVGVCRQHHPPNEGEPKENLPRLDEIYVKTIWSEITV